MTGHGRKYIMFELKEKVFYGVVGICEITDIAKPPITGVDGDYYYLQPIYDSRGIIYSPVNSNKVTIRSMITQQECQKLYERAKNCKKDELFSEIIIPQRYDEFIKSQDPLMLMQLIRSLYNIKNERAKDLRKMKSADSRILSTARKLLYGEIAVSMGRELSEVSDELDELLGQN